jgi:uncharacterized protein with PQ loop repeat
MNKKTIYIFLIIIGVAIMFYSKNSDNINYSYFSILGFAMLMFGLYKTSTKWVKDESDDVNKDL